MAQIENLTDTEARDLYWEAAGNGDSSYADEVKDALWDRLIGRLSGGAEFEAWLNYRI